jgi:hypothetical protein
MLHGSCSASRSIQVPEHRVCSVQQHDQLLLSNNTFNKLQLSSSSCSLEGASHLNTLATHHSCYPLPASLQR